MVSGYISPWETVCRVMAQMVASLAAYHWVISFVWDLTLTPIHVWRSCRMSRDICFSFLEVSTPVGALVGTTKSKQRT